MGSASQTQPTAKPKAEPFMHETGRSPTTEVCLQVPQLRHNEPCESELAQDVGPQHGPVSPPQPLHAKLALSWWRSTYWLLLCVGMKQLALLLTWNRLATG